uniref:Uncharacterized protein n=1 Tax=Physcomitrium patens TaxID=3218 RepID=A0A7I4D1M6_PHYPA
MELSRYTVHSPTDGIAAALVAIYKPSRTSKMHEHESQRYRNTVPNRANSRRRSIGELEINTVVPGELQIRHLRDTSFSALDKSAPIVYIGLLTAVLIYCACRCDNSEVGVHELQWFNSGNKGTLQVAMRLLQAPPLCTKSVRVFVKMHAL